MNGFDYWFYRGKNKSFIAFLRIIVSYYCCYWHWICLYCYKSTQTKRITWSIFFFYYLFSIKHTRSTSIRYFITLLYFNLSLFTKTTPRSFFTKIMKILLLFYPISFLFSTIIHSYLSLLKVVNYQPMKELVICNHTLITNGCWTH